MDPVWTKLPEPENSSESEEIVALKNKFSEAPLWKG